MSRLKISALPVAEHFIGFYRRDSGGRSNMTSPAAKDRLTPKMPPSLLTKVATLASAAGGYPSVPPLGPGPDGFAELADVILALEGWR